MTHDELVQFAAEKVGGETCNPTGSELCVKTLFTTLDPTMCSGWHIHDLTSPDLFFEGLAAAQANDYFVFINTEMRKISVFGMDLEHPEDISETDNAESLFNHMSEIPQKFWECWAEMEGRGDLTKED